MNAFRNVAGHGPKFILDTSEARRDADSARQGARVISHADQLRRDLCATRGRLYTSLGSMWHTRSQPPIVDILSVPERNAYPFPEYTE